MNDENKDKYKNLLQHEQILIRPDQHIGTAKIGDHKVFVIDSVENPTKLTRCVIRYSPGLIKCFDEILNNAADHKIKYPKLVTRIEILFDPNDYSVTIINDGPGITSDKMECNTKHGKAMVHTPQAVFSEFNTSSSYVEDDDERITGGRNGYGAKLTFLFATYAYIETVHKKGRVCKKYTQIFENNLSKIHEPVIENYSGEQYTIVKYILDFDRLNMNPRNDYDILNRLFYTRSLLTSDYLGIPIKYNNNTINPAFSLISNYLTNSLLEIDKDLQIKHYSKSIVAKSIKGIPYKWDVIVLLTDKLVGFQSLSVVNGLTVLTGGHINHIKDTLTNTFKPKIQSLLTKSDKRVITQSSILDHFVIYIRAQIPNPGWQGQTKEKLNIDSKLLNVADYKLGPKFLKEVWDSFSEYIMLDLHMKSNQKAKGSKKRILSKKYKHASKAGTNERHNCSLILSEGDSASTAVKIGVGKLHRGREYYGIYELGGVIMNSRKQTKEIAGGNVFRNKKLDDSKKIQMIVNIIGLDYSKTYDCKEEIMKLNYGRRVIIATDQDTDGIGNIFSLVLNFIEQFWPNLIKFGFICRLSTPVVIAKVISKASIPSIFPKNLTEEYFYMEDDFQEWLENREKLCINNNINVEKAKSGYNIQYFKGLGRLEDDDIEIIFEKLEDFIIVMQYTPKEREIFNIYYGKDTGGRKLELSTTILAKKGKTISGGFISCEEHLRTFSKMYFFDKIERNLLNPIDGFNSARRKVIATLQATTGEKLKKIFVLGGTVTSKMHYHHGDASINGCLTGLGQNFRGKHVVPLLIGKGQFGSLEEGDDYASARYIEGKANKNVIELIFPKIDNAFLNYMYDEGEKSEPEYYIPIIPFALLQNYSSPGAGWKLDSYARDYKQVFSNIRKRLNGENIQPMNLYDPWDNKQVFLNDVKRSCPKKEKIPDIYQRTYVRTLSFNFRNSIEEFSIGYYEFDDKNGIIEITALPIGVWSSDFMFNNIDSEYVKDIEDHTTKVMYKTKVYLTEEGKRYFMNAYDDESMFDKIETYFGIYKSMKPNLNYYYKRGVQSFNTYEEVFDFWFDERYKTYKMRIERLIILLKIKILMEENSIRYIKNYRSMDLVQVTDKRAYEVLEMNNYLKVNTANLSNNVDIKNEFLENYILKIEPNYNYLSSMTDSDKYIGNIEKRECKLQRLQQELLHLHNGNIVRLTWLEELDKLESVITKGIENNWNN